MPSKLPRMLAVAAILTSLACTAFAQDAVNESTPQTRDQLLDVVRHAGYRLSCTGPRFLGLCGASRQVAQSVYRTDSGRDSYQYNAVQRLAGMIADRMEAGHVGNVKLKFKIILE